MAVPSGLVSDCADPKRVGEVLGGRPRLLRTTSNGPTGRLREPGGLRRPREPASQAGCAIVDSNGVGPSIFFQPVPEPKVARNRLHIGRKVGSDTAMRPRSAAGGSRLSQYCSMEVRGWSATSCWQAVLPGARVVEVQPAGAVQGLLGLTDRQAAWQHRVLIAVPAGQVDGKPPQAGGAAVAQPAQRQELAALEFAVDVGEPAAEADIDAGQAGPALPLALAQPLPSEVLVDWGIAGGIAPWCLIRPGVSRSLPAAGRRWLRGPADARGDTVAPGGGRSPSQITLRASERRFRKARAQQTTAPWRQVVRARIMLLAPRAWLMRGTSPRKLGIAPNTVGKRRKRFWKDGIDGLADRKRPGRPRVFAATLTGPGQGDRRRAARYRWGAAWPLEPLRAARRTARDGPGGCHLHDNAMALAA
jgi:hypothetical protein